MAARSPTLKLAGGLVLFLLLILYLLYPKAQPQERGGEITAIATFFPLYEFTKAVAGERVEVVMLVPPGIEPHDWDPSPRDMERVAGASVFVYNGGGLEPWASSMVTRTMKTVDAYQASNLSGGDPHVWLDPIAVRGIVAAIADSLAEADPGNAGYYRSNAADYSVRLDALDSELRREISGFRSRKYVALHPAFEYFDRRYGLEQVAYFEEVPGREPSAFQMAQFIETVRANNITVIFTEPFVDPKPALSIAKDIEGGRVMMLDPVEIGSGKDYFAIMKENVEKLKEALG